MNPSIMKNREQLITAAGHRINTLLLGEISPRKPTLVFIHGGLDCIGMWREFPHQLCQQTGLAGLVYDRWGHGKSEPLILPRAGDPREDESGQPLADIFSHFAMDEVILVGHSFGGAIALIAASRHPKQVCASVSIAPQLVMHEDSMTGLALAEAAFNNGKLRDKLIPFHGDKTDTLFRNWASMVDHPSVPETPYERRLQTINCPVLALFGMIDNYGYKPNLNLVKQYVSSHLHITEIPDAAHYPHLETADVVIDEISQFIENLPG